MIRSNMSRVRSAFAFDAHENSKNKRPSCRATVGTIEKQVVLRQQVMQQACDLVHHRPDSRLGPVLNHSTWSKNIANCYWDTVSDPTRPIRLCYPAFLCRVFLGSPACISL